uniref:Uncharacterized protein n=1 Tax=viral metagenome TaxID=1070528 RepID=A0A6C0D3T9_9ZZZZ
MEKVDTRKKTRKQKEKNRKRKKTEKRKSKTHLKDLNVEESFMNRIRRLHKQKIEKLRTIKNAGFKRIMTLFTPQSRAQSIKIRKPTMIAPRGFMSKDLASRMPLGSSKGLITKMNKTYAEPYNFVESPRMLAEPVRVLSVVHNKSLPRKLRFLKEAKAIAIPIHTSYAETYEEDPGITSEIVGDLMSSASRRMTRSEINKEHAWAKRNAERSRGQRASGIVWPQSKLRQGIKDLTNKEKEELLSYGQSLPNPNAGGYNKYDSIKRARKLLKKQRYIHLNTDLSPSEHQKLKNMGIEYVLPEKKDERLEALKEYREFLVESPSGSE